MSAGLFLLVFIGLLLFIGFLTFGASWLTNYSATERGGRKRDLVSAKQKLAVSQRALRAIASGDRGNPVLDAQLALDEVERLEMKELN